MLNYMNPRRNVHSGRFLMISGLRMFGGFCLVAWQRGFDAFLLCSAAFNTNPLSG